MPLLTHTTPAPKRIALSCEFTKDQKAAEERLGSAKMYEDVDLRGIPLLEFPASLLEQPTGAGVAQFDAATLGSMLAADRDAAGVGRRFVPAEFRGAGAEVGRRRAILVLPEELRGARGGPCLLYTSPSPRDKRQSRMPSSA